MKANNSQTWRYCGRDFSPAELDRIRQIIASDEKPNRAQISRRVCQTLGWYKPDGGLKQMSCRVALLRMERDGLLQLPEPQKGNGNGKSRPRLTHRSDPQFPVCIGAGALGPLRVEPVTKGPDSRLWNELIARYHYLGYTPLPGAQLRYFVLAQSRLLAALGFGASAWKVEGRDRYIGWTAEQRERHLHLVLNNARFLILPWVRCRNLASRILSAVNQRLASDWQSRYHYRPVLLETFVDTERFTGSCYKAANWIQVGLTQGRGKLDTYHQAEVPKKHVLVYPLVKQFRSILCS